MATTKRSDCHSPTNLVTEDYTYVTCFDNQPPNPPGLGASASAFESYQKARHHWQKQFEDLSRLVASSELKRGLWQCHHCGSRFRYLAVMKHTPTDQHIAIGETCLDNRFELATADFHRLRKAAELDREKQRISKALESFVNTNPDLAFMTDPQADTRNPFVSDVAGRLRKYGDISDRQIEAVRKSIERDVQRKQEQEARAAIPRIPALLGRQTIEGVVVSLKEWTSDYGTTWKMTVVVGDETAGQWTCWGSVPTRLEVEKGDRVRFTATFEPGRGDDDTFAAFKRPTGAEVIQ